MIFDKLLFAAVFTTFCVLTCQTVSGQELSTKPNIVLIVADDLGYGDLSCYGHPTIHTPRIDQLAQLGIKHTSFYTGSSVCTPSRASFMTGKYPIRAGLPGNLGPGSPGGLEKDQVTLAEKLKAVGYRTAAFGKWHLGAVPGYMPTDRGFDEYLGLLYSNDMMPPWVNTDRPLELYHNEDPIEHPVDQTTLTKRYAHAAIDFIKQESDQPFFIYLPHSMPHLPIYASQEFQGKSDGGDYGDVIEEIDATTGQIVDVLMERNIWKNTLFIVTSDNGPWRNMPARMFNTEPVEKWHGGSTAALYGAKATSHEGGQRVPAIVTFPGKIPSGQVSAELCSAMDVHATILELAGIDFHDSNIDGTSLWEMWTHNQASPREEFFYMRGKRLEAMRDSRWKLRVAVPADGWTSPERNTGDEPILTQLFDLRNDPFEQFNRADDRADLVAKMKSKMKIYAKQVGATIAF